jgi:hypothetical protein
MLVSDTVFDRRFKKQKCSVPIYMKKRYLWTHISLRKTAGPAVFMIGLNSSRSCVQEPSVLTPAGCQEAGFSPSSGRRARKTFYLPPKCSNFPARGLSGSTP